MRFLHVSTSAIVVAGLLGARNARAQEDRLDPLGGRHNDYHSSQNFAVEFRFSPYTPNIDSDPALNGNAPFAKVFGDKPRFYAGAEFDWQALRIPHFGTLGPGLSVGYTTMSDPAPKADGTGPSGETTSLWILPFTALAVLRVDVFWREFGIPVVPYAKVGVAYALWRASNTLGTSSTDGVSGKGHSWGLHYGFGVAFNLNPFDPYSAQNLDDAMGINNTYIFAEWTRDDFNGLGFQSDPLRVGGSNWMFGLALEF